MNPLSVQELCDSARGDRQGGSPAKEGFSCRPHLHLLSFHTNLGPGYAMAVFRILELANPTGNIFDHTNFQRPENEDKPLSL